MGPLQRVVRRSYCSLACHVFGSRCWWSTAKISTVSPSNRKYTLYGKRLKSTRRALRYCTAYASGRAAARSIAESSSKMNSIPRPACWSSYQRAASSASAAASARIRSEFNEYEAGPRYGRGPHSTVVPLGDWRDALPIVHPESFCDVPGAVRSQDLAQSGPKAPARMQSARLL